MIYRFTNDYSCFAHEKIIKRLLDIGYEQNIGYGLDRHTENATRLIKEKMDYERCDIHFLVGGTQTNMVMISSALKNFEAVICVDSGHINVHETGAIEGVGHKCLVTKGIAGKITVDEIKNVCKLHADCHMVKPKMVYISNSTEVGTIYRKSELIEINKTCKDLGLYLYMDGARLGSALSSIDNDITLNDLANLTDAFYIGGTKHGNFMGEALVLINDELKKEFRYNIKHHGAMLSKGYACSIGYEVLFEDDLFFEIGRHENECANYLETELKNLGFKFYSNSSTNQIFPIFKDKLINEIKEDYGFEIIERLNNEESVIRFCTSFDTKIDTCKNFILYIKTKI